MKDESQTNYLGKIHNLWFGQQISHVILLTGLLTF